MIAPSLVLSTSVLYRMALIRPSGATRDSLVLSFDDVGLWCWLERHGCRDGREYLEVAASRRVRLKSPSMNLRGPVYRPEAVWACFWEPAVVPAVDGRDHGWLVRSFPRESAGWIGAELASRESSARRVLES